jgi:hypothetical protein
MRVWRKYFCRHDNGVGVGIEAMGYNTGKGSTQFTWNSIGGCSLALPTPNHVLPRVVAHPLLLSLTPLRTKHCQQHEPFIGRCLILDGKQRATLKLDCRNYAIELKLR